MHYLAAAVSLCIGLIAGWVLGERSASPRQTATEGRRVPYQIAEPAAGTLQLDSLVLHRNPGFAPLPQYEINVARTGRVTYRGYLPSREPIPDHQILGRAGEYFTRIDGSDFVELTSLALWPERPAPHPPAAPIDGQYAQVTLFFSKVLVGEGDPEFASIIERTLIAAAWDSASVDLQQ